MNNHATDTDDAGNHPEWNSAAAPGATVTWNTTHASLPVADGGHQGFDTSAATSGWNGYEYLASIFKYSGGNCLGVASAPASTMVWGPMTCINPIGTDKPWDAPFLSYDIAGSTLWVSGCSRVSSQCWLYKNDSCIGSIGGTCLTPFTPVTPSGMPLRLDHSHRIVANRCDPTTAGAFMATRSDDGTTVQITQFFATGAQKTCSDATDELLEPETNCTGGGSCSGDETVCKCGGATSSDCTSDPGQTCAHRRLAQHRPQGAR